MAATTFTCFDKLPIELQMLVWRFAATAAENVEDDSADGRTFVAETLGHPTYDLLLAIRTATFHATPHNFSVFKDVYQRRNTMMRTCSVARLVAFEMWKKDVRMTPPGAKLYNCLNFEHRYFDMRACILECLTNTIEDLHFWRELAAMVETMNEILRRLKA